VKPGGTKGVDSKNPRPLWEKAKKEKKKKREGLLGLRICTLGGLKTPSKHDIEKKAPQVKESDTKPRSGHQVKGTAKTSEDGKRRDQIG